MVDFSRREKRLAVFAVTAALAFAFYRWAVAPVLGTCRELARELSSRERRLKEGVLLASRLEEISLRWRAVSGRATEGLGGGTEPPMAALERWARGSGVDIREMRPVRIGAGRTGSDRPSIHITMEADWVSFVRFLGKIESPGTGLFVKSCDIRSSGGTEGKLNVTMAVE